MNAHKTPPTQQAVMCNTQPFISTLITGKKGEMTSLLSVSHTLAVNRYTDT